jgi:adenylosuccinate lyase
MVPPPDGRGERHGTKERGTHVIERYTRARMASIWSDEARFGRMLEVELTAAEEMAKAGLIPPDAAKALRAKARVDLERIQELERTVRHDVIAFVTQVAETVGPEGRYLHYGLTSSDVLDTALALGLVEALEEIQAGLRRLRQALRRRAQEEAHTLQVGRTHGVHAEPITFGLKLARHDAALARDEERLEAARQAVAVGKLSGAVGTYAHVPPTVEAAVMARLGLRPEPVASQVVARDRHAQLLVALAILAGNLDNLATEVRHLARTEVGEAFEPFAPGQKGSSAMPHKRNPVNAEKISGLSRLVRSYAMASLEQIALWHERDISHSSVERIVFPDATIAVDHMLVVMTDMVENLDVDRARMRENLERTDGRVYSEAVLLALVRAGADRQEAYAHIQAAALDPTPGFRQRLRQDPYVQSWLRPEELDAALSDEGLLQRVDGILARLGLEPQDPTS